MSQVEYSTLNDIIERCKELHIKCHLQMRVFDTKTRRGSFKWSQLTAEERKRCHITGGFIQDPECELSAYVGTICVDTMADGSYEVSGMCEGQLNSSPDLFEELCNIELEYKQERIADCTKGNERALFFTTISLDKLPDGLISPGYATGN